MKPVIIQTLIRNMRKNIKLPVPSTEEIPKRKDRSGQFLLVIGLLVIIALILM